MDLVKAKVKLAADEKLVIPAAESDRTTVYNGSNYYHIYEEYDSGDEVCEYLVNTKTGQIIECNQGQYTPIN